MSGIKFRDLINCLGREKVALQADDCSIPVIYEAIEHKIKPQANGRKTIIDIYSNGLESNHPKKFFPSLRQDKIIESVVEFKLTNNQGRLPYQDYTNSVVILI